jgi:hypothetical protein
MLPLGDGDDDDDDDDDDEDEGVHTLLTHLHSFKFNERHKNTSATTHIYTIMQQVTIARKAKGTQGRR